MMRLVAGDVAAARAERVQDREAGTVAVNSSEDNISWDPIPLNGSIAPAGSPGHGTIELTQLASPYLQLVYTATSGSGAMTITCFAKDRQ